MTLVDCSDTSTGGPKKKPTDQGHGMRESTAGYSSPVARTVTSKTQISSKTQDAGRPPQPKSSISTKSKVKNQASFGHIHMRKLKQKKVGTTKIQDWLGDVDEPIGEVSVAEEEGSGASAPGLPLPIHQHSTNAETPSHTAKANVVQALENGM